MPSVTNRRILFKETPSGLPIPGQTTVLDASQIIDLENVPLNGGILLKTLVLSLDPFILIRMRPSVFPTYVVGEPIEGGGVAVVVRSENPAFQVGDYLSGMCPFAEYSVQNNLQAFTKIDNKYNLPPSVFVGVLGFAGMTAYCAWKEYSRAKKGEVAFVSTGAGGIGSVVIQLAKRDGMKVIASAGSDDKIQYMKDLGADVAFNYKTTKTSEILEKEGPIDVYWDNVGGETVGDALNAAARYARFIECGMTSGYADGVLTPVANFMNVITKEITIHGFSLLSLLPKHGEAFAREVPALVASKELTYMEHVTEGLENAEEILVRMMKSELVGKSIIRVADH